MTLRTYSWPCSYGCLLSAQWHMSLHLNYILPLFKFTKTFSYPFLNYLAMHLWIGQNTYTNWFCRYSADNTHFYNLSHVKTSKIMSSSPNSSQIIYLLNNTPSFVWIYRMIQDILALLCSLKPNHFFPISKWCSQASLVKIYLLVL